MRKLIPLIGLVIVFVLSVWTTRSPTPQVPTTEAAALVTRVVDGDTLEVELNNEKVKVRLIGVNTPESVDPRRPVECFGKEASVFLKSLVENKNVSLEADPTQANLDKYGRYLRYVYANNELINLKLITSGYAYEYTYDIPYLKQAEFKQAQVTAQKNNLGLWNPETCPVKNNEIIPTPISLEGCVIKGNISNGVKIYHLPNCRDYGKTQINLDTGERWFCNESEATASGWRKAENCN